MPDQTTNQIEDNIHAKHVFTQEETIEISRELGRTCTQIATLESEKSAVTKDFAARIETKEIMRDLLVDKITSGYEMRPTDCIVVLDPKNRSKDYFRKNAVGTQGEYIERREMTHADFQLCLPAAVTP